MKQGWTTDYSNENETSISGFKFQHVSIFIPSVFSVSSVVKSRSRWSRGRGEGLEQGF